MWRFLGAQHIVFIAALAAADIGQLVDSQEWIKFDEVHYWVFYVEWADLLLEDWQAVGVGWAGEIVNLRNEQEKLVQVSLDRVLRVFGEPEQTCRDFRIEFIMFRILLFLIALVQDWRRDEILEFSQYPRNAAVPRTQIFGDVLEKVISGAVILTVLVLRSWRLARGCVDLKAFPVEMKDADYCWDLLLFDYVLEIVLDCLHEINVLDEDICEEPLEMLVWAFQNSTQDQYKILDKLRITMRERQPHNARFQWIHKINKGMREFHDFPFDHD